jgi:hypothetical protein
MKVFITNLKSLKITGFISVFRLNQVNDNTKSEIFAYKHDFPIDCGIVSFEHQPPICAKDRQHNDQTKRQNDK